MATMPSAGMSCKLAGVSMTHSLQPPLAEPTHQTLCPAQSSPPSSRPSSPPGPASFLPDLLISESRLPAVQDHCANIWGALAWPGGTQDKTGAPIGKGPLGSGLPDRTAQNQDEGISRTSLLIPKATGQWDRAGEAPRPGRPLQHLWKSLCP